jgi:nucleoside 2-deoxyribosyltransferase
MNETTNLFGFEWKRNRSIDSHDVFFVINRLENDNIGSLIITDRALEVISDADKYKIPSLIYEQKLYGNIYSVMLPEEREHLQWRDSNYLSVTVDEFLDRFPSTLLEKQCQALLSLYKQYPDYGQHISNINTYTFFAKEEIELGFILESMVKKNWVNIGIKKDSMGRPHFSLPFTIADDGWIEIEKAIKSKANKQVFVAMKFKDMDDVHTAIRKAITEASFTPFRIDEKDHINQISSEIQYEIKRSGLMIADVTGQNQGVYFEAGFAMGLNIPVIWSCREDEIGGVHFDTRQYNHIIWKDESDLCEKLTKRIIAVMGLNDK